MSKLAEILKIESSPRLTPVQKRTVRLVKLGAFLRAYDWSAWLLKRYGSSLNTGLDRGDGSPHIFVGFPVSSADKFVPEGCEVIKDGDGVTTEWIFPATKFPPEDRYGLLDEEYSRWLSESLAALESEQHEKKSRKANRQSATAEGRGTSEDDTVNDEVSASPLRLTDVAREILHFPLDRRSPDDCVRFIRRIKGELLDLL